MSFMHWKISIHFWPNIQYNYGISSFVSEYLYVTKLKSPIFDIINNKIMFCYQCWKAHLGYHFNSILWGCKYWKNEYKNFNVIRLTIDASHVVNFGTNKISVLHNTSFTPCKLKKGFNDKAYYAISWSIFVWV